MAMLNNQMVYVFFCLKNPLPVLMQFCSLQRDKSHLSESLAADDLISTEA